MDQKARVRTLRSPTASPHQLKVDGGGGDGRGCPSLTTTFPFPSVYRCGSSRGWSRRFRFRALKNGPHWSPRLAVFGDLGADNPKALPRLRRDTQQGMYDAVLHVGEASARVRPEVWGGAWVGGLLRGPGRGQCGSEGTGDAPDLGDGVYG